LTSPARCSWATCFAEPVDVHRPARDEVLEQLPLALGAQPVGALREDLALGLDRLGVAERTALGRAGHRRALLGLGHVRRGRQDLRDDVAGAQDDDVLAGTDVLADDVLLVVERGQLHRDAADVDWLEHGERVQVAEPPDVPLHVVQARDRGRGRELPGDRPAGVAPHDAEAALEREVVDLDDAAVDLEVELAAALLPGQALGDDLVLAVEQGNVVVDAQAVVLQPHQRVVVAGEADALGDADAVAPHRQRALGGELGIELADRAGGGVTRVHERRQALLGAALVERGEVAERHVDLAADLDQRRRVVDAQRDRRNRAQVVGDILADLAVAARGPAHEHPVAVQQRDRQPVDLRLGHELEARVLDPLAREVVAHPLDPGAQLLLAARVGQREHRLLVRDLGQVGDGLAARSLRGRVGREQLGVLGLDRAQLVEQRVVLVVGDLGVVEDVVAVAVVAQLVAQLRGTLLHGAHLTSLAAGASSRARS
jgi:hypothetical protein